MDQGTTTDIRQLVDYAMGAIERDTPALKEVLKVINFLNENQGAITAIATVTIAILAWFSFRQNRILIKENRLLRKAGTEPKVVAYIKPDESGRSELEFILANIGRGPAFNVSFNFCFDKENLAEKEISFSDEPNRTAINILPQDERIITYFGYIPSLLSDPILKPFTVIVKYSNQAEEFIEEQYTLDISQYLGYNVSRSLKYRATKALEIIAENISKS